MIFRVSLSRANKATTMWVFNCSQTSAHDLIYFSILYRTYSVQIYTVYKRLRTWKYILWVRASSEYPLRHEYRARVIAISSTGSILVTRSMYLEGEQDIIENAVRITSELNKICRVCWPVTSAETPVV